MTNHALGKLIAEGGSYLTSNVATRDHYTPGTIPKFRKVRGRKVKVGTRQIFQPLPELAKLQEQLIDELRTYKIGTHDAAHAYRSGRSVKSMAAPHVGKLKLMSIDIKDFFPSVKWSLVSSQLPRNVPRSLQDLIRRWCFLDGGLPQGAPSSPFLCNVALYALDQKIAGFLRKWRSPTLNILDPEKLQPKFWRTEPIAYTRYSDDLVFSSNYQSLQHMEKIITSMIRKSGFVVNPKKIKHSDKRSQRQYVTGIVINEKLSAPKALRRRLRSDLHRMILDTAGGVCPKLHKLDAEGNILPLNEQNPDYPFAKLAGEVEFVRFVCPEQAEPLTKRLEILIEVHTLDEANWSDGTSAYTKKCLNTLQLT